MGNVEDKTIKEIKSIFDEGKITVAQLAKLKKDKRKGVEQLINRFEKKRQQEALLKRQYVQMRRYEEKNYEAGKKLIAGVDEAGRGPLAGPVVAAAVILPETVELIGINDSKQLNHQQRAYYYDKIKEEAICYSVAVVSNRKIDEINIYEATKQAMKTSIESLEITPEHLLIDAMQLSQLPCSVEVLEKGDQKSISIAAASILAKVTRDQFMETLHHKFPAFHFHSNMGYGTKHHLDMLAVHGPTPFHRKTFSPVKKYC